MEKKKKPPLKRSFGYAFAGIIACICRERNMKIHCCAAALVVLLGLLFGLSLPEWCSCLAFIALVISLELVNTALEAAVDLATEEQKPLAKLAKDAAAGAVLIAAVLAAVAGALIFGPRVLCFFL